MKRVPRAPALAAAAILAILVAACGGASSSTPSTAASTKAIPASSTSAEPAPTPRPTPTEVVVELCPADAILFALDFLDADPACFDRDVKVRGWLDDPPGMGFDGYTVEPEWLYYPPTTRLSAVWTQVPIEPDHACPEVSDGCGWFFIHVAPGTQIDLGDHPRWVVVTGHLDDPASESCAYVLPSDDPGPVDNTVAIESCRSQFVAVSLEDLPAP